MNNNHEKLRMMMIIALFAALIGIFSQIVIPLPLVPITGQTLAIGLAATILGARYGTYSVVLYLFIGATGVPIYAQMTGGLGKLFGPTGGFLFSFVISAFIIGFILEKARFSISTAFVANIVGMIINLTIGTIWLKFFASLTWEAAFLGGFAPFIIGGIIKAFLAAWIGILIRSRLETAKMLPKKATIS
ncbi:biotin transporter BioY [Peribacillus asahii]|uniref:biotin transporter BioY n=1 Tax=Peribacillus asahii TaxID=228899 RepID=UPI00382ABA10